MRTYPQVNPRYHGPMAAAKSQSPSKPRDLHAAGAALWRRAVREFSFNSVEIALILRSHKYQPTVANAQKDGL